jgi:hypothetical protein
MYVCIYIYTHVYTDDLASEGSGSVGDDFIRQQRQHTSAYFSIRQHTSAYVSIRQHTSAYVRMQHLASEGSGGVGDYCLRSSFYQSVGGAREGPQRAPYCHLCHSRALTEP